MKTQREFYKQDKKLVSLSNKKNEPTPTKNKIKNKINEVQKNKVNSLDQRKKNITTQEKKEVSIIQKKDTTGFKNIKKKVIGNVGNKQNLVMKQSQRHQSNQTSSKNKVNPISTPKYRQIHNFKGQRTEGNDEKNKSLKKNSQTSRIILGQKKVEGPRTLKLQNFQIGKKLGKGRFGDVFLVKQKYLNFVLAMKIINKKLLKQSDMQNQLLFQIKIQTFLNHPNTLKMYGFFHDDKSIYLLVELASSGCLFRELKSKNFFKEDQAAYYLRQIVAALKSMHQNAIMHRDIKPQNILNSFGVLKLCDFGWSVYSPLYQRQTFCGTLDYVPPEIVVGEYYDEKVDIWCLGILCYELCTGHAPFEAKDNELQTYDKILSLNLEFPMHLSNEVVDFISKLLIKDPLKRMNFEEIEGHCWMKKHENESGRLISKQIWEAWMSLKN